MIVKDDFGMVILASFKVLIQRLPGEAEKCHQDIRDGRSAGTD
jgi:hypothetical protein